MHIAIDVMGGDHAPAEIVKGAVDAARRSPEVKLFLVGREDDIVRELVSVLQIRLGVGAGSGRARSHDVDTEAYEAYLQGLYQWANRHEGNNRKLAIDSLRLATQIDPGFADAFAAYALSLLLSPSATGITSLPPTFNCSTSSRGTVSGAAVEMIASKGAFSGQPLPPSLRR